MLTDTDRAELFLQARAAAKEMWEIRHLLNGHGAEPWPEEMELERIAQFHLHAIRKGAAQ